MDALARATTCFPGKPLVRTAARISACPLPHLYRIPSKLSNFTGKGQRFDASNARTKPPEEQSASASTNTVSDPSQQVQDQIPAEQMTSTAAETFGRRASTPARLGATTRQHMTARAGLSARVAFPTQSTHPLATATSDFMTCGRGTTGLRTLCHDRPLWIIPVKLYQRMASEFTSLHEPCVSLKPEGNLNLRKEVRSPTRGKARLYSSDQPSNHHPQVIHLPTSRTSEGCTPRDESLAATHECIEPRFSIQAMIRNKLRKTRLLIKSDKKLINTLVACEKPPETAKYADRAAGGNLYRDDYGH